MIIDASVAYKWLVDEPGSDAAERLLEQHQFFAPHLMQSELGNALWKAVARGELDPMTPFHEQLSRLSAVVATIDETPAMARALELAIGFKHEVYDCVYLALAERQDDVLVTADEKFLAALGTDSLARRVRILE